MPRTETDIESMLEKELQHHLEQAARCRRALAAYRGEDDPATQTKPLGWAAAIDELFQQHEQLTVDEVRSKLVEMGLPAQEDQHLNTIRSTLARKAGDNGTLERVSPGVYKKKTEIDFSEMLATEIIKKSE